MTAEIINLRQARKARARTAKEAQAEENRAKFGASSAARRRLAAEKERAMQQLNGAEREPPAVPRAGSPVSDEAPPTGEAD